jgi:hypothetical protein
MDPGEHHRATFQPTSAKLEGDQQTNQAKRLGPVDHDPGGAIVSDLSVVRNALREVTQLWIPRILSQIDRDPTSSTYGCCDRNWWHYKIRDFPSIILQQAAYAVGVAYELPGFFPYGSETALRNLVSAGCLFWQRRALRHGAFEEYYPWEQGYAPLAFSTLAVMKLASAGAVSANQIQPGAKEAAIQLTSRFEAQAANQQVAGLAALGWLRKILPNLITSQQLDNLTRRTIGLQHEEGWFNEYGGPDLGYLTVAVDCLWDLFDATGEECFLRATRRAIDFMLPFVRLTGSSIGMHNARNTDYLVPYGIARSALDPNYNYAPAIELLVRAFCSATSPDHFLQTVDDRYLCHYIGHSVFRALALLEDWRSRHAAASPAQIETQAKLIQYAGSGHRLQIEENGTSSIVSLRKGGILTVFNGKGSCASDFGWIVKRSDGRLHVTHYWSDRWEATYQTDALVVRGALTPCSEHTSSPLNHLLLRVASLVLGNRLSPRLKSLLIFRKPESPVRFERLIRFRRDRVIVKDMLTNLGPTDDVLSAPRASKLHVASADNFHPEDLTPARGLRLERTTRRDRDAFHAKTIIMLEPIP